VRAEAPVQLGDLLADLGPLGPFLLGI